MLITAVGSDGDDDLGLLHPALEALGGHVVVERIDRSAPAGTWSPSDRTNLVVLLGSDWSVHRRTGGRSVHAESRLALAYALRGASEPSPIPVVPVARGPGDPPDRSHRVGGHVRKHPGLAVPQWVRHPVPPRGHRRHLAALVRHRCGRTEKPRRRSEFVLRRRAGGPRRGSGGNAAATRAVNYRKEFACPT